MSVLILFLRSVVITSQAELGDILLYSTCHTVTHLLMHEILPSLDSELLEGRDQVLGVMCLQCQHNVWHIVKAQ